MSTLSKFFHIIVGVIIILFGIYLWGNTAETLTAYSLYLGIGYILSAVGVYVYYIINKICPLPYGNIIVSLIIGITILSLPTLTLTFILWIFIVGFLLAAIYYFYKVTKSKGKYHILQLTVAILGVAYGFLMMLNPIMGANTMAKILAAFVVMNGVSYLFSNKEEDKKQPKIEPKN